MKKILMTTILIVSILVFMSGCRKSANISEINDFYISYLEIQDNKLLVEDEVTVKLELKNATDVTLNIKEYGQDEIHTTIEGQESGGTWEFLYENTDPFTNEVWLVVDYDGKEVETDKKIITNIDQSYENAFESIIPISNEINNINVVRQEVNIDILGWYDDQHLLARDHNELVLYNPYDNTKEKIIDKNIWNVYPSPHFRKLVYQDQEGLYILDINKKDAKEIINIKESTTLKDLAWSWDENKVMINILQENQDNSYIIIDLNKETTQVVDMEVDGYAVEDLIYLDSNHIFALANRRMETDSSSDSENLKTLISVDINTKRVKDYTPNSDVVDEIRLLSQVNDREFLIRIATSTISEDSINRSDDIYLLNTYSKTLRSTKKDIDSPYIYSLSPNKDQYIYLKDMEEDPNENLNEKIMVLGEKNKAEIELFRTIVDYPRAFYWSDNQEKIVFYMDRGKEIYLIEKS